MIRKKYFLFIIYICIINIGFFQIGFSQESNNNFEQKAKNAGINLEYIKQQSTISRYDVTRLLNAVECIDCINPSDQLIQTYTNNFWIKFTALPGKDFDDIFYKKAVYNNQSYYYCVATVADKEYMFGYPILTSPLCPGDFCGTNNITRGEFVQVIINILSRYIRKNYTTDWKKVKIRYDSQIVGSYSYNIFNEKDKSIILNKAQQCEDIDCPLGGSSELHTYLKYCMFNLDECQMKEFGRITKGYWPISELNIAIQEGIIVKDNNFINNIHKPIDGKTAIEAFGRIFTKTQCNFNIDYDCDGILNQDDNCPNHYNPSQKDTDGDIIGDVCDDDIDGDGILNPIGIVDERGSLNIGLRTSQTDNCLFIQNKNQYDNNNNYQGDSCDLSTIKGVTIGSKIIGTGENSKIYAYIITDYNPIENDRVRNIDGKFFMGKEIFYPITKSGLYTLYVQSKSDSRRKASITLITQYNKGYTNAGLSISLSKEYLPVILTAKITTIGVPETIIRDLEGPEIQSKITKNSLENSFLIRKKGNYTLTSTIKNQNNEILGITSRSFLIEDENNNIQNITINNLNPNIGEQIILNINVPIKERKVNRGDGVSETQSKNNISHTYQKNGIHVIQSTIILSNDTKINDYKTIIVKNNIINDNKILQIKPFILEGTSQSAINLIIKRIGYNNNDIISRYYYDGIVFSNTPKTSLGVYNNAGIYYPETKEILGVCQYTSSQSTIVINNSSFSCLNMKINNIKAQCDMDGDGIDDRCDDDIDGDSIKNPIGLIIENDTSCDINKAIIDKVKRESMINQLQGKNFNNICKSLDNCPLQSSTDQTDGNNNGIGDICQNNQYNFGESNNNANQNGNNNTIDNNTNNDSDGDGINNNSDNCPNVSETYNGYQDSDGCPELGNNNTCETNIYETDVAGDSFIGFECLQCPCQYAQESADINPGDIIRTTLRNISGSILQARSNTKTL